MKPIVVAAAFSLLAGTAFAQGMTETTTTTTTISPADETEMHDYIVKEHRAAITPPPGFVVTNGAVLPETVDLYSFPAEHHWNYEYANFDNETVVVDPTTRRIIHVFH